jgi:starvation-inducible DNA-binding protein
VETSVHCKNNPQQTMTSLSTDITGPAGQLRRDSDGNSLRSIGRIGRLQRFLDKHAEYVTPLDMLAELRDDNKQLGANLRKTRGLCDEHGDVASVSLLESWIDEAERRAWFLFEATRRNNS